MGFYYRNKTSFAELNAEGVLLTGLGIGSFITSACICRVCMSQHRDTSGPLLGVVSGIFGGLTLGYILKGKT